MLGRLSITTCGQVLGSVLKRHEDRERWPDVDMAPFLRPLPGDVASRKLRDPIYIAAAG